MQKLTIDNKNFKKPVNKGRTKSKVHTQRTRNLNEPSDI